VIFEKRLPILTLVHYFDSDATALSKRLIVFFSVFDLCFVVACWSFRDSYVSFLACRKWLVMTCPFFAAIGV